MSKMVQLGARQCLGACGSSHLQQLDASGQVNSVIIQRLLHGLSHGLEARKVDDCRKAVLQG